ncbi:rhomboid family intramembrane serine protease [Puteibacter caeruleilacunae]|nr:rhomboid family intramembrane serine protease [Puteibacter caeruleilacunae]
MSIADELKYTFKNGSYLTRLIYINLGVFLFVRIVYVFFTLFGVSSFPLLDWLSLPSSLSEMMYQPWSLVTYMFLHFDFLHILFNILWLYWFGKIFLAYLDEKKLLATYLIGGLFGGLLYMLAYNIFPAFENVVHASALLGASASVVAIVVAISVYQPNHVVNLLLVGPVRIKYIALFSVLFYLISIASSNPGGHLAHLGGALWGYWYIVRLRKGKDLSRGFSTFIDKLLVALKPKSKMKVSYRKGMNDYEYNAQKNYKKDEINKILDKIGKSGYDSLSREEKEILFKMGNKGKKN